MATATRREKVKTVRMAKEQQRLKRFPWPPPLLLLLLLGHPSRKRKKCSLNRSQSPRELGRRRTCDRPDEKGDQQGKKVKEKEK
jgi:hypothetical protein